MTRLNKDRLSTPNHPPDDVPPIPPAPSPPPTPANLMNFAVPTEAVELPSKGRFYGESHPLHNCETIEIHHMTAKEEDILTSASLLKQGLALDRMVQSIIVDKRIKVADLLIGDKNALLVASRVFGYGPEYTVKITCPRCATQVSHAFDLAELCSKEVDTNIANYGLQRTENNTFLLSLPKTKYVVEFRLLTGRDETGLDSDKHGSLRLLESIVLSINDQTDQFFLKRALSSLPIIDASILKRAYLAVMPDMDMSQEVTCEECGETSDMGVPLDAGFFWPQL